MDSVIAESRVTLDPALLGQNVIVLALQVAYNLGKAALIVNAISKAGSVDNRKRDTGAFLVQLQLDRHRLDLNALFEVRRGRVV